MSDTSTPTVESLEEALIALQNDADIFWLLFGAILVFCELVVPCVLLSRALFVVLSGGVERQKRTIYPTKSADHE